MNEAFKYSLEHLDDIDCQVYAGKLIKMLAALSDSIDECATREVANQITVRFTTLIGKDE